MTHESALDIAIRAIELALGLIEPQALQGWIEWNAAAAEGAW